MFWRDQLHYCIYLFSHFIAGQEFMIMHHKSELQYEDTDVVFLCLLCERTLSNEESYAHVFSREHIASFLVSISICFFCGIIFLAVNYCNHLLLTQVVVKFCLILWNILSHFVKHFNKERMSMLSSDLVLQVKSSQSRSGLNKMKCLNLLFTWHTHPHIILA